MFLFMPSLYPGVNMYLSMLIAIIITVPTGLVFGFLSASMPRSGGGYVYVSRILGPALGTMANWDITIWWFFYGGAGPSPFLGPGMSRAIAACGGLSGTSSIVAVPGSASSA